MSALTVIASAVGGGLVAVIAEAWVSTLRRYEIGRLLVTAELTSNIVVAQAVQKVLDATEASDPLEAMRQVQERGPLAFTFSTDAWNAYRDVLALRLRKRNFVLFAELLGAYTSALISTGLPLQPGNIKLMERAGDGLAAEQLRLFERVLVYGPWALRRRV